MAGSSDPKNHEINFVRLKAISKDQADKLQTCYSSRRIFLLKATLADLAAGYFLSNLGLN